MRSLKTLGLAIFAAALLVSLPAFAGEPVAQPDADAVTLAAPAVAAPALEAAEQSPAVSTTDTPVWLADGPRDENGSATESHCYVVSNWCASCSGGKIKSCDRYRCQVGPDIWYYTSCTSCANYC